MDIVAFGIIALVLAVAGLLATIVIGLRDAVQRRGERRYLARNPRYARRARLSA